MKPAPFAYARPKDWSEALSLLAAGARPGAGTQSLGPLLNLRLAQPDTIADLRHLPDYAGVALAGGVLRIGAGTTHAAIEDGAVPGRLGEMGVSPRLTVWLGTRPCCPVMRRTLVAGCSACATTHCGDAT